MKQLAFTIAYYSAAALFAVLACELFILAPVVGLLYACLRVASA